MIDKQIGLIRPKDIQGTILADIEFGSPASKDCLRFGICRIDYWEGKAFNLMPSCCKHKAQGYLRCWEQVGIELIFPNENLAPATLDKHFGSGLFQVEEAYHLPKAMASQLGLPGFVFEPGSYPILEMNGRLHVIFD